MTFEISAIIKFLIKVVVIMAFIWLAAYLTPKIAGKTDKIIDKHKKKNSRDEKAYVSNDDKIRRTDVFGPSYEKDVKKSKKVKVIKHREKK